MGGLALFNVVLVVGYGCLLLALGCGLLRCCGFGVVLGFGGLVCLVGFTCWSLS